MVIKKDQLWVTDDADVVWSLQPDHGQVLWKQVHLKARGLTSPVWTSKALVVADRQSMLHALSLHDGTLIGRMNLSAPVWTPPVAQGKRLFVLTENGYLYAIDIVSKRS
ncbi:MAG: hypothetical protein EB127_31785 [Alphaproteobacteria bacterium]|nr:hypothetical protein [Alphaproteobacteria bacterium]